ncbi:exopolysaccharide production protein ExoF [Bosea sp. OK403]|uniref:polysaccharide biosynthesis/export family protein n=1 Tax=Bosea sp. OK403 TaxID=1855286 RepID=UPI0008E920F9|nr:polysaccharide biosynthesis/export family protein [Bosea sp. OK403]SFJ61697.1 exopolysaccharide production protein ExoF [Bosea sp. OK403]
MAGPGVPMPTSSVSIISAASCLRLCARLLLPLLLSVLALSRASADDLDYRLGPDDRLRIKVSEWRPVSGDTFEWAALNGEFTINSVGILSMPIIGAIRAENATTVEIAAMIAERLKAVAGLIRSPNAAVEIAQYRPFYILGTVEKPGEYAYRPGLSVIQAISIAGGFFRSDSNASRFEREAILAESEIRFMEAQRLALLLKRDRLLSELRKSDKISFSDEVVRHPDAGSARQGMEEEAMLFASRQLAINSQRDLLLQAKALLEGELKTLGAKTVTQQKQYDLVRKELDNINALVSKGLAVNPRQLAVEQNLAQIESQGLDLVLAIARTKQDISRTERNLADLKNQREADLNKELRETQVSLQQATDRVNSQRMLLYDSRVLAPRLQSQQASESAKLSYSIVRRQDGLIREIAVDQTAPVRPGDIVKIERAPLAMLRQSSEVAAADSAKPELAIRPSN